MVLVYTSGGETCGYHSRGYMVLVHGGLWVLRKRRGMHGVSLGRPVCAIAEERYGVRQGRPVGTTQEKEGRGRLPDYKWANTCV